eukprot:3582968-Prymnesium_polylepis.3
METEKLWAKAAAGAFACLMDTMVLLHVPRHQSLIGGVTTGASEYLRDTSLQCQTTSPNVACMLHMCGAWCSAARCLGCARVEHRHIPRARGTAGHA